MAAAAMTACSQVETTSVNPDPEGTGYITFSPVVPKATRGTVTKIDQLKNQGFYVVAYGENSFYFNRLLAEYKEAADDNKGAGILSARKILVAELRTDLFRLVSPRRFPQTEAAPRPMTRTAT